MNALTIEQLKALEVGEWVWIITEHYSRYVWIDDTAGECLHYQYSDVENRVLTLDYSDYGIKWTAYKNKEQAEGKYDSRVEQAEKQTAKEILQELYNLPVCTHPTIGTGQYTFGRQFVKDWAKSKYGVEVDE